MDYKKHYQSAYVSSQKRNKAFAIQEFESCKRENRPISYAISQLRESFFDQLIKLETGAGYSFNEFIELYYYREEFYSTDATQQILSHEIQTLFLNKYPAESYLHFLKKFAVRKSTVDTLIAVKFNTPLLQLIYHLNCFEKITFEFFEKGVYDEDIYKTLKANSSFAPKIVVELEDPPETPYMQIEIEEILKVRLSKIDNKEDKKVVKKNKEKFFPEFEENEKILLIHFLFYLDIKNLVEKAKLISLIGGTESGYTLFTEDPKYNKYYAKVRQGHEYYGKGKKEEILKSVLEKIKPYNLSTVNTALKMKLIKAKNEKVKK